MNFFLIAGEASGDLLGADLITAIRRQNKDALFYGAGGGQMRAAGQKQSIDLAQHAVLGAWEVLKQYPKFHRIFHHLLNECVQLAPEVLILIDYPGFNIRFLKKIRSLLPRTKIFFYVSPQVWAWKPGRARILENNLDALLCIFPFEPDWYREKAPGLKTIWVGHPIFDRLFLPETDAKPTGKITISLLPGSRMREVEKHLPILLEAAQIMTAIQGNFSFLCLAPTPEMAEKESQFIEKRLGLALDIRVLAGYTATYLMRSHLALVASGTATLECAVADTPMVVFYQVNPITYLLGKLVVKVPYLAMINLLLNKEAVPELVQNKATPHRIARAALELLTSDSRRRQQQQDLRQVLEMLGAPGASQRAASFILSFLANSGSPSSQK